MELLTDLRDKLGLSYVFITHDLSVVRDFADRVMVMKGGSVVESGHIGDVFERPTHSYTRQLLASSGI
jgi:peptide/nickel transport system ATP-binding protein